MFAAFMLALSMLVFDSQSALGGTMTQLRVGTKIKVGAQRTLLMAGPGRGKTHLLSEFDRSFFVAVESGTTGFSPSYACHFFEVEEGVPAIPRTFATFLQLLARFVELNAPAPGETQRPYAHLMIDSYSAIEDLIHAEVCRQNGARSMEDADYGPKLYMSSIPLWKQVIAAIDTVVTQSGANVWITGHTEEENTANQAGETYKRTTLRVKGSGKSQNDIRSLFTQAMDNVWLLEQQITVKKGGRGQRTVALAGGRIILTQPGDTPGGGSYEAKSRIRVPERIPATQEDIRAAMKAGITRPAKRIKSEIEAVLAKLPEEQRAIIVADLQRTDNAGWLDRTLARAKALLVAVEADAAEDAPDEPEQTPATTAPAVEPAAEKKQDKPAATPVAHEAKPVTTTPAVEGKSEAMRAYMLRLAQATTNADVGRVAVDSAKDQSLTAEERAELPKHIQARRQELK
jgi:hypothetical protein